VPLTDLELSSGADDFGPHITVAFTLPAGSFATVALGEITKAGAEGAE
jgi:tRNA(Glu) U13 pseudouridine synthase TruD